MRFIPKNSEPDSFTMWKQEARAYGQLTQWDALKNPQKRDLFSSLIQEQGHICCYCGQRITQERSHIEHLKPREKCIGEEMFDYKNLLASCPGYPEAETHDFSGPKMRPEFCGHKKGNWYDPDSMVSPLVLNCDKYFRYPDDGQIIPTEDPANREAARKTIQRLGLDKDKLSRVREDAIAGLGIADLTLNLSADEIRQFIHGLNQPDSSGELTPFCFALIYQLQQFLPTELT
jgi:uncharacterized protein (TIGR02646 family)